ncbi:J domain-containing protein [Caldisericum sp. AR60]|uniref:J domain-containing protein n=1 Tax=Caldisericum sp. AR60 TaxID=3397852 RepID=UPI0039FBCDF2
MKPKNYYDILGVRYNATPDEIKKAYQELIKKYHPDLHQNDSEEAKKVLSEKAAEINEAYATLIDPVKRKAYDEQLFNYNSQAQTSSKESGYESYNTYGGYNRENEIFREFFYNYVNYIRERIKKENEISKFPFSLLLASFSYFVMRSIPYYPKGWDWIFVALIALIAWFKPTIGILVAGAIYAVPIAYNSIVLAEIYIVFLFITFVFGIMQPYHFVVFAATVIFAFNPKLYFLLPIIPFISGFLPVGSAFVTSAIACFMGEVIALLKGESSLGLLLTTIKSKPLVKISSVGVKTLRNWTWIKKPSIQNMSLLSKIFTPFIDKPILIAQIILWGIVAFTLSFIYDRTVRTTRESKRRILEIGISAIIFAAGNLLLYVLILNSKINAALIEKVALHTLISSLIVGILYPLFRRVSFYENWFNPTLLSSSPLTTSYVLALILNFVFTVGWFFLIFVMLILLILI